MSEPLARSPRQVAIADHIWETFNSMSADMGVDRDGLINQALFAFARQNGYLQPHARPAAEPAAAPAPSFVPVGAPAASLSAVAPFAPPPAPGIPSMPAQAPVFASGIPSMPAQAPVFASGIPSMPAQAPIFASGIPSMPAQAPVFASGIPSMPAAAPVFPPSPSLSAAAPFGAPQAPVSPTNQGMAPPDMAASDQLGGLDLNAPASGMEMPNGEMSSGMESAGAPMGGGAPDLDAALAASDGGGGFEPPAMTGEPPPVSVTDVLALFADGQEIGRVTADRFLIGRGKHCDLVIHSGKVSREHAAIMKEGGQYFIEDLGSSNGTWFDKKRITKRQISDGEEYFVCSDKITFRFVA
jgi:hypothetical protein